MTTGNILVGDSLTGFTKVWSGGDGKYEILQGAKRIRFNNYTKTQSEYATPTGIYHPPGYGTSPYNCSCKKLPTFVFPANDDVKLQNKLVSKIRGHDFNAAKFSAEIVSTSNMVIDTVSSVARALIAVKHGNFTAAARALRVGPPSKQSLKKDLTGRWLELQYGWLPLLSDVEEAMKALHVLTGPPRVDVVNVSRDVGGTYDGSTAPTAWKSPGHYTMNRKIIYEMTEQLSVPRTLGLCDPLGVAWEIIPYSFVVDWFIPVGTYLDNLSIIPKLKGRSITTTVFKANCQLATQPPNVTGCMGAYHNYININRVVSSSGVMLASPGFSSISSAMSPKRVVNAIALAAQRIRF